VNFYKHHIGDYAKKTAHLTVLEHGAYLLMLHAYYGTEKPLPFGRDLYRICRAFGKKERAAVDKVAAQFWTRTNVGFVNGRAFYEIKEASELSDIARENGKLGGRPKKPSGLSENNPAGLFLEPSGKAIQTPDSIIQSKKEPSAVTEKVKSKPKTTIPEDLRLSDAMREQVLAKYPDADADEMFLQFRAHHEAHGKVMKSWPAAWTTWIGNAANFGYPKISSGKWL
jgi:uncharacterized protein YdaU (DUF1376 family)